MTSLSQYSTLLNDLTAQHNVMKNQIQRQWILQQEEEAGKLIDVNIPILQPPVDPSSSTIYPPAPTSPTSQTLSDQRARLLSIEERLKHVSKEEERKMREEICKDR